MIVSYAQSKIKDVYTMLTNDIGVALSHQLLQYNAMIYYQYIEMLFSFMYLITFNIYESKTDFKKKAILKSLFNSELIQLFTVINRLTGGGKLGFRLAVVKVKKVKKICNKITLQF